MPKQKVFLIQCLGGGMPACEQSTRALKINDGCDLEASDLIYHVAFPSKVLIIIWSEAVINEEQLQLGSQLPVPRFPVVCPNVFSGRICHVFIRIVVCGGRQCNRINIQKHCTDGDHVLNTKGQFKLGLWLQ